MYKSLPNLHELLGGTDLLVYVDVFSPVDQNGLVQVCRNRDNTVR